MSDQYGKGYWGTGQRPTMYGADQAAYDIGAQRRRDEEYRRQQERQQRANDAQRAQEEQWRRQQTGQFDATTARPGKYSEPTPEEAAKTREAALFVVSIGAFIFVLVSVWNALVAPLHPTNQVLAAIVQHGAWGVGVGGFLIGRQIYQLLSKIILVLIGILLLIVAIAFAGGIVSGVIDVINR